MILISKIKNIGLLKFVKAFVPLGSVLAAGCVNAPYTEHSFNTREDFNIEYREFIPEPSVAKKRSVIILPPTGGATHVDRSYAKNLRKQGARVYILTKWTGQDEEGLDLALHQRLHERAVKAIEVLLARIPEDHRISLMGTSVGGLFVSIAASQLERPDRVLVVGSGVPIPEVIVYSDQKAMKKLKDQRYEKFNFKSDEAYLEALSKEFTIDPTQLPPRFKEKARMQILLTKDTTVPVKNQRDLNKLWNPDLTIEIESGHFWGIAGGWWSHSKDVEKFLLPEE